jgi:hypothetical protein
VPSTTARMSARVGPGAQVGWAPNPQQAASPGQDGAGVPAPQACFALQGRIRLGKRRSYSQSAARRTLYGGNSAH